MTNGQAVPQAGKWSDLALRSASAVVLMPIALYCVWQGGIWFHIFLGVLAVLMAHEWVALVHGGNMRSLALHVLAGLCGVFVTSTQGLDAVSAALLVIWLFSVLQWVMNAGTSSIWALFGVFYIGLPMVAFILLREDVTVGLWAVLWCFIVVWAADISAYFAGRALGGAKLAPRLSPKKTWWGLIGAMTGAALASSIFAWALGLNVFALVLLACFLTLVEQAGDILESALKRRYGVKESGVFIPGHGGVLDRVDGLIAVIFAAAIIGFAHQPGNAALGLLLW